MGLETEEEKQEAQKQVEENKELLSFLTEALEGKVKAVILSKKLKSHPVCLSMEMEKVLNSMPAGEKVQAQRVLEINASHPVFQKLAKLFPEDKETVKKYASLLYNQALLIEGVSIEDPLAFSNAICDLMVEKEG